MLSIIIIVFAHFSKANFEIALKEAVCKKNIFNGSNAKYFRKILYWLIRRKFKPTGLRLDIISNELTNIVESIFDLANYQ